MTDVEPGQQQQPAGTPDEVGPAAEVVPGVGPTPEPEPEGFREEQIEAEERRQRQEREETAQRSDEAKEFYSGGAADDQAENPLKR
jgi:hypothetical protein